MGCTQSDINKKITLSELKTHNTKDNLWIKIDNKVYDLTDYQQTHPGGALTIQNVAGTDATDLFLKVKHSENALRWAEKYYIGDFYDPQSIEEKKLIQMLEQRDKEIKQLKERMINNNDQKSVYELLGGQAAIDAFVPLFYKYILADNRIKHYFARTDINKLMKRQNSYLSYVFGGPNPYIGKDMIAAHKGLNLQEKDYNAVIEIAAKALTELGVPKEVIGKCAEILAKDKEKVLHK